MISVINFFRTNLLVKHMSRYVWVIFFLASAGCVNGLLLTTPPGLQIAMDSSEKLRMESEAKIKLVKNAEKQGQISSSQSQLIQISYTTTQQLFSSWIDYMQNKLRLKGIENETIDVEKLSLNAANQAREFNALVNEILQISSRGDENEIINAFKKSRDELIETIKQIDQKKRQELILKLENLRWKAYQDI